MIGILIDLLAEVRAETEALEIAKGKNKMPNFNQATEKIKEVWQSKKK